MSKYIDLDDDRLFQILHDEVHQAEIVYKKLCEIASAEPVWHGRWNVGDDGTYCSNCGKKPIPDIDYDLFWQPDYCPNCGAKMKEE